MLEYGIGNTSVCKITSVGNVDIYAKMESENPTGSVKDRASYYMLSAALKNGDIKPGGTVIEPTSGNTGIGLSFCAKQMGLKAIMVMPESMSRERVELIESYGAEVVLSKAEKGMQGSIELAMELRDKTPNSFIPMQFENMANVQAHIETTAPEIFAELPNVDWIVSGVGSGGTAMGIKEYIKQNNLSAEVCAVQPKDSPVLTGGQPGGHKIQGIGANFLPLICKPEYFDKIVAISNEDSYKYTKELKDEYDIFAGLSSGAAFAAALVLAEELNTSLISNNTSILVILPDSGSRYLSTGVFDGVCNG